MAFDSANLACHGHANGFGLYRYDSIDSLILIEAAGYMNNLDDNCNLAKGDEVHVYSWTTAVRTGTLNRVQMMGVTNVIANDAAASAGAVNLAEIMTVLEAGEISSLA